MSATERADVVVVGAGFAGLTAARAVEAAGRSALLIEARDRVGGRVQTVARADGSWIDVGGQWVGPTQDRLYALAAELGVATFATWGEGQNLLDWRGRQRRYRGTIPPIGPIALLGLGWGMWRLNAMARRIPVEKPWTAPGARALDRQTLGAWIDGHVPTRAARELLEIGLETVYSCDAGDVSLLHALFYVASAGSIERLVDVAGGAQQDRFIGGAQTVADRLAATLREPPRLGRPVRAIAHDGDGVTVIADGLEVRAARVIVALPPPLVARIDWRPALPGARDQLLQRLPMGSVVKCTAVYETPFWRARGLSGQALSDVGPVHVTFDNTPPAGSPGMLMGFVEGNSARAFARLPVEERRSAALSCFARLFGDEAKAPIEYVDRAWSEEEWSRGCYAAFAPPGVWTAYEGLLAAPLGRVHFAGTETSPVWNGYIEGAIRSGARAAGEVIAALA